MAQGIFDESGRAGALDDTNEQQIYAALYAGRKIEAIRLYRTATGAGLKESKEFIDALEAQLRQEAPEKFTARPAKGCSVHVGALALAIMISVIAMLMMSCAG